MAVSEAGQMQTAAEVEDSRSSVSDDSLTTTRRLDATSYVTHVRTERTLNRASDSGESRSVYAGISLTARTAVLESTPTSLATASHSRHPGQQPQFDQPVCTGSGDKCSGPTYVRTFCAIRRCKLSRHHSPRRNEHPHLRWALRYDGRTSGVAAAGKRHWPIVDAVASRSQAPPSVRSTYATTDRQSSFALDGRRNPSCATVNVGDASRAMQCCCYHPPVLKRLGRHDVFEDRGRVQYVQ